jgi:hypothetical protein
MKKIIALLLVLLVLPMTVGAADVQSMIDGLPAVNVLQEMDMDRQREVYHQTQAAYDAYMALSDEEKAEIVGAEEVFEELFGYFNTLVSPAEEVQEETGSGANILSTVISTAIGILLAQKIITKRKMKP